jgi:hypothetical protein
MKGPTVLFYCCGDMKGPTVLLWWIKC